MTSCRICNHKIELVHDFGRMPLANGFLHQNQFANEYFFNLAIGFCSDCSLLQLIEQPEPKIMFHDTYPFFTGSSQKMTEHFSAFSEFILKQINDKNPFIIEIGSNDGTHLKNFARKNIKHLGIEPSANVAQKALASGVDTLVEFFTPDLALKVAQQNGPATVITTANVLCHIPDLSGFIKACDILLKKDGLIIFEDPYLGSILEKTAYDQIYDEHVTFFSLTCVSKIFSKFGFELVDALPQWTHGGSMRYILARKGERSPTNQVETLLKQEYLKGLSNFDSYKKFSENIQKSKNDLVSILNNLKQNNKKVCGYAATSKSTTVLNYCGIKSDLVSFICDTTPLKQGKFSPGAHIPITDMSYFYKNKPDYALLFGWNHAQEILEKEKEYLAQGGQFIFFVPEVSVWPQ